MLTASAGNFLLADELGNLRRYAFCLFGNRALGDSVAQATIKTLRSQDPQQPATKADLYRVFNTIAGPIRQLDLASEAMPGTAHGRLLKLPLRQRQIAALKTVCGFKNAEIGSILNLPDEEVARLYVGALKDLAKKPMAVLIIEDEALIALELRDIVTSLGLSLAGIARNRSEALRLAGLSKPQLILADYKLQGDTGVAVVKAIRQEINAGVIYVTAHPEAAVTDRELGDTVLSKPIDVRAIERAVHYHLAA